MRPYARPLLLVVLAASCAAVGLEPIAGESPHHVGGGFRNADPTVQRASGAALRANHTEPTVTWIGHATVLLQLQGVNLLTDPHWSRRASPLSWAGPKRLQEPALAFEDLPPIHVVLISHDHYDHLDVATVKRLHAVHDPVFVVPLGLKAWLLGEGISRVVELDWWGAVEQGGLRIVCTPAQHFSQRSLWDSNTRLWASWAVLGAERRFYFSGDTGYFPGLREIGEKLGPFDLTAMAIGAYMPPAIMRYIHLTPEQAVQAHEDLQGRQLVGIHWGTFDLAEEPLDEPPVRMLAEASRRGYAADRAVIPALGETRRW